LPDHVDTVPGVISSGLINCLPLTGHCSDNSFHIEGRQETPGQNMEALARNAGPGYFTAAGIPLVRGRTFTMNDGIGLDERHPKPGSIVINSAFAKMYFPNEDPIGKRIFLEYEVTREKLQGIPVPSYEIIGVVGDARANLDQIAEPAMYRPLLDHSGEDEVFLTVHTFGPPLSVASGVRQQISRANPNVAVDQIRSMQELAGLSAADHQFNMALFGSFAVLALLLASAGLYAVLSYTVSERKNELGIRMALGATSADVSRWVLRQGLKPAIAGVVLGLAISAAAGRIIKSLLFGVETFDPITFAVLPLLTLAIAALACYIPAVRATRIDPTVTLRME
jgi:putative ABC transport system permease protein